MKNQWGPVVFTVHRFIVYEKIHENIVTMQVDTCHRGMYAQGLKAGRID